MGYTPAIQVDLWVTCDCCDGVGTIYVDEPDLDPAKCPECGGSGGWEEDDHYLDDLEAQWPSYGQD